MTKFMEKKFTHTLGGDAFSKGYDQIDWKKEWVEYTKCKHCKRPQAEHDEVPLHNGSTFMCRGNNPELKCFEAE